MPPRKCSTGKTPLSETVATYLRARGITVTTAKKRGLLALTPKETAARCNRENHALEIPYYTPTSEVLLNFHAPFSRYRLFSGAFGTEPPHKFAQPKGTLNHIYYDPVRKDWPGVIRDPSVTLVVTEGEVKAMAATDNGLTCIGIGGVWSWRTRINGRSVPLPEFDDWLWSGRVVELVFDSDTISNPQIQAALCALAADLSRRGAFVKQVVLPKADDGQKVGLDDFLMKQGRAAFDKLERIDVQLIVNPAAPLESAQQFISAYYTELEGATLLHYRDSFHTWNGCRYEEVESAALRSQVYNFLHGAMMWRAVKDVRELVSVQPNTTKVNETTDALRAATHTSGQKETPLWLDGRETPEPRNLVVCSNGVFDLETRQLHPLTSRLFALVAVPFAYDPNAPEPVEWLKFLWSLWPSDPQTIETLQEVIGYLASNDNAQQKIFLLITPKRGGKGTILNIITELLGGKSNVATPTLNSFSNHFGLESMIGKSVAAITDARLGARVEQSAIAENLLRISGGDSVTIPRKYKHDWSGQLPTRFLVLTNELPRLHDASGALASRFIVLRGTQSFFGCEDHQLLHRLTPEIASIFNWSLRGLDRLRKRGRFVQPDSSTQLVQTLEDLGSPISAFIRDCCEVGQAKSILTSELFQAWVRWGAEQGREHHGTAATFGRDLHAATRVESKQAKVKGKVVSKYFGICLKQANETKMRKF